MTKETITITISQDGEVRKTFEKVESDTEAFGWLLRNQGQSTDWALRHGGWKVEVKDDQTGEITFWEPYSSLKR